MKKQVILAMCGVLFLSLVATAQATEKVPQDLNKTTEFELKSKAVKFTVAQDKIETLEITGTGSSSFSNSNTFDGSVNSYKHALRITISLLTNARAGNYQLVFYSDSEMMPVSASSDASTTIVYFPLSMYEGIKGKLEQSLIAKRKIQLKVTQKQDGFREGELIF